MKAVYPGSFYPIHSGHIDILRRAVRTFGSVTLLIAENPAKSYLLDSAGRLEWCRKIINSIGLENVNFDILNSNVFLGDYCKQNNISHIVKGLRNGADLDSEMTQEWYTKQLNPDVETVYFSTADKRYISSSSIRQLTKMEYSQFVNCMKNINYIEGMNKEDFEDYIKTIYRLKNG